MHPLQALFDKEAAADKKLRDTQKALAAKVLLKFRQLTVDEVKVLVVDDKWLASLEALVGGELAKASHALSARVGQLAKRYGSPLASMCADLDRLSVAVDEHLQRMGFVWQ